MKHTLLLLVTILGINSAHAQWREANKSVKGNGNIITKTYNTSSYDSLSGKNGIHINLIEGIEGNIAVEAESNIMEYLVIKVIDNRLEIGIRDDRNINTEKGIKVTVPIEKITRLSMAGNGDIASNIRLKHSEMYITLYGSGSIDVDITSEKLHVSVAGNGDVKVSGRTEQLAATVAGSGYISGFDLKANHVDVSIAGSGDVSIYC
jgi:hypothetical protein